MNKIGKSGLSIDLQNLPARTQPFSNTHWEVLKKRFKSGEVGFYDTPTNEDLSHLERSIQVAKKIPFKNCLLLGVGGSALGPICLSEALEHLSPKVKIHYLENPDPLDWKIAIEKLRPEDTLVCSVTKSGNTFETMALTLLALEWLGRDRWKTHFLAITDPKEGDLRSFCNENKLETLAIEKPLGGRFSVFSPVGLFPLALEGRDAKAFIKGARAARDFFENTPPAENAIFDLAHRLLAMETSHPNHVFMPYSSRLRKTAMWWVQLWGESLGKANRGFTPLAAVGATDQHSLLQLLVEGPDKNVTFFLDVDQSPHFKIPALDRRFELLSGNSLQELLNIERHATTRVFDRLNRPFCLLKLDRIDEESMGGLLFSMCVLTAYTGTVMGVDPFNQPGVQEGKNYILESFRARGESH